MSSQNRRFEAEILISKPLSEVFLFFSDAKNLELITPPWLSFRMTWQSDDQIKNGTEFKYQLNVHGIRLRWHSRIVQWEDQKRFTDIQLSGPYAKWEHQHLFESRGESTWMKDIVDFKLPFGIFGDFLGGRFIERDIQQIFNYRTQTIKELMK